MAGIIETFFLAMTPVGELRASLPVALAAYNMNWLLAFLVSVIGNLVPVIFLLLFLGSVSEWLSLKIKICNKFFSWLFERTRRKSSARIEKYGSIALISFVAIPLPFTGAWTGAVAAFLFGIPFKKAFPLIAAGVVISGAIVLLLTQTVYG
ncbi:hypothetical protein AMJ47_03205 [Parcubacteria bacterium DG_72]|nr:MAG: hypothetical protein AMJ47_03205 [Parcubacteria bacterium DG_72]